LLDSKKAKKIIPTLINKMNILTAVLAFFLGGYVAESISMMTSEKMQAVEKNQKAEVQK
jgi:ABC-type microcin C transport system permease subunit YejB